MEILGSTTTPLLSRTNRTEKNQGMNWISQHKRLAIYLRDGLACCYCGKGLEQGVKLTLDHLIPYSKGGAISSASNLITCCLSCNSARGNRPRAHFVASLSALTGLDADEVLRGIANARRRKLDLTTAKAMIARRKSCLKALLELIYGEDASTAQAA
ncbi:HNH endonuclease [Hymenobacter jeollabukensis]|uniref:HNH endonuclease n=1 Tax=Hymenobacter jeollabukensis TaxID=2025313 RepID=A0A5R8WIY2_9BACT|nr:HNH endonuclease [Hymenobacter jeollabukensis]TLM88710.1 HNH endonuclease [Hymenobacter jeollabukensis]